MSKITGLIHASELLTGDGIRKKDGRRPQESDLGAIPDGAIFFDEHTVHGRKIPGKIIWVGPTDQIPKSLRKKAVRDLKGKAVVIPAFTDCHTHLVFGGDRSNEFARRCAGATYQEIAQAGGGILTTVRGTRTASQTTLLRNAIRRVEAMKKLGIKTIEVKSGYTLTLEGEKKQLTVTRKLQERFPELTFQNTFLGAHAFPPELSKEAYFEELCHQYLPVIAHEKLADACDIFIDEGYFTLEQGRKLLKIAQKLGLKIKIHADELVHTGSAELAVELGALSADHLLRISDEGIRKIAASQTVAVLLPGTAFYLKAAYAPARRLIDNGACVAVSTDFNPGSSACLSLPVMMTLSALYMGMSKAEIFASVTYNASKALGLEKTQGTLTAGLEAKITALPFERFEEVYYRFAEPYQALI